MRYQATRPQIKCWRPLLRRLTVALIVAGIGRSAVAVDTALAPRLAALLEEGWGASTRSLEAAEAQYGLLTRGGVADVRVPYAMAIVAIKHHRYERAGELFDEVLRVKPGLWLGVKGRLWLGVVTREYDVALMEMVAAAGALGAAESSAGGEPDKAALERVRYLGRLYGYLEAPAEGAVAEAKLRQHETRLLAALPGPLGEAFDEGRKSLIIEFAQAQVEYEKLQSTEKASEAEKRAAREEELSAETKQIAAEQAAIEEKGAEMKAALETQLGELDAQLSPLQKRFMELRKQAEPIESRLRNLDGQLDGVRAKMASLGDDDGGERGRLRGIYRRIEAELRRERDKYRPIEREGTQVQRNAAELLAKRQGALATFENETKQMERTASILVRRQKRVESDQKKLDRAADGNTTRVRTRALQVEAFTTYEPFPLEAERQKVLDSLK